MIKEYIIKDKNQINGHQMCRLNIKCINFKSIHYAINLDVVSFFMIFSDFDYIFISMYF